MHLITVTRPERGFFRTGVWMLDIAPEEVPPAGAIPAFLHASTIDACSHSYCIKEALAAALSEWDPFSGRTEHHGPNLF